MKEIMKENIRDRRKNTRIVTELMLKLLPVQILMAAVTAVNGIVSSFFASNFIGVDAMGAVGLYGPINMLLAASAMLLSGGSAILCGKYLGRNEHDKMQNVFSLDLVLAFIIGAVFSLLFLLLGLFDLTGIFTSDPAVRPYFNRYLMGQALGMIPFMLGNQLPAYLAIENKQLRATTSSLVYSVVNVVLNILFVRILHMEALGLALASSIGLWIFLAIQATAFLSPKSHLRFTLRGLQWKEGAAILRIGLPGAACNGYQVIRGIIVNYLLQAFVGAVALSAFAASDSVLRIFWAVPTAMLAVSRLMISISVGEEDRHTLADIMWVMFTRYIPMMCGICLVVILMVEPFTRLFFRDPADPVYMMTVWGFRILPLCMPLSIVCTHFICYGQASGKNGLVHVLSLVDGLVFVAGFSAILTPLMGINGVYIANVLNGVGCIIVIVLYACLKKKHFPTTLEELMVIPEEFGAGPEDRIDIEVHSMEEVVTVSEQISDFCSKRGVDKRRAYLSGLCMEEMAGNVVEFGFAKDKKKHAINIRVVHKNDGILMRIRDDCAPFNPDERRQLTDPADDMKNAGIRMVYKIAQSVEYQNILGMNVLTIRI